VEACSQRLAAGRGEGYPIAAATAASNSSSSVIEWLSTGRQV